MISVPTKLPDALGFLRFVFRRWREDRCPQIAGSLTYTTLLALVPIFAIAVAVLSSAPLFAGVMTQFKGFLVENLVPSIAERIIGVYMATVSANAERLTWTGAGVVLVIAVAQMLIIDRSLNAIWRVRRSRALWRSLVGYALLLVAGPVLIGISVSITTYLLSLSITTGALPREWQARALRAVPVSMSAAAFFLMYVVIPNRRVPWRHAALGAIAAAILFEGSKELFATYVRYAPTYNLVYGTFAAVPVFLIWIYLSWLVVLLGAELTVCLGYWRSASWKMERTAGTHFRAAIAVARALLEAAPAMVTLPRLREATAMPLQEIEDTLLHMRDAGLARSEGSAAYGLARDASAISFGELYRATVGPIGGILPAEWAAISPAFERAACEMEAGLARPLSSLLAEPGAGPAVRKAGRGKARSDRSSR